MNNLHRELAPHPEFARWKPSEKGYAPAPSWDYLEAEAWIAAGYPGLSAWDRESGYNKARVLAHYLEKLHREGYEADAARKNKKEKGSAKDKANPDSAANDSFRYRQAIQQDAWAARLARKKKRDGSSKDGVQSS